MKKNNLNQYFLNDDFFNNRLYSLTVVKSLIRSILEPVVSRNSEAFIYMRLNNISELDGLIKRIEYLPDIILKQFNDFEFSKSDNNEVGFVLVNSLRYNCVLLFREVEKNKFEIYLRLNSKIVSEVYEALKLTFVFDDDKVFYSHKTERRENEIMNSAVENILKYFQETTEESEYNQKIQETYKNVNLVNEDLRNEVYESVKAIAHEIKNQLSILDIYSRILEKKSQDEKNIAPIKKSIKVIKRQLEQFKNIDVVNLAEKNVKEIIHDSIKTYSDLLKENNNRIILIDEIPDRLANAFVDEEKLSIVINNVIKNANDSTKNDEIQIRLKQNDDKIKISFINHGEKIENSDKNRIFSTGYTTKKDGWGVGLSVCKKYVGSQFGTFELEKSDEDETIFSLKLPLA